MADDHNALLARADQWLSSPTQYDDSSLHISDVRLIADLAAELRALTSRHGAALDAICEIEGLVRYEEDRGRYDVNVADLRAVLDQAKDPDHE